MGSRWARATRGFPRCEGSRRRIVPTGGREDGLLGYGRCHQQKWGCVYVCMYIYILYIYILYVYILLYSTIEDHYQAKFSKDWGFHPKTSFLDSATKRSWMSKNGGNSPKIGKSSTKNGDSEAPPAMSFCILQGSSHILGRAADMGGILSRHGVEMTINKDGDFTNEARDRSPKKHQKTPFLSWQQAWKGTSGNPPKRYHRPKSWEIGCQKPFPWQSSSPPGDCPGRWNFPYGFPEGLVQEWELTNKNMFLFSNKDEATKKWRSNMIFNHMEAVS